MAQQPMRKQIVIDVNEFIRTRDALGSAYLGLSASLDKAVKAYLDHTNVVLAGDGSLDVSYLTQPFIQLAQTAQEALLQGTTGTIDPFAPSNGVDGDEDATVVSKRKKRPYKKRDPNAPKRPQTAYFRYLNENRPHFAAELAQSTPAGTQRPGDITKLATEKWHKLTNEEQEPYRQAYKAELAYYKELKEKYIAAGGDPDGFLDPSAIDLTPAPPVIPTLAAVLAEEESSSAEESSSEESSDDSDDEPPPPPKTPTSKAPKSSTKKAAKEVVAAAPPVPAPAPPPPTTPHRKRKSASNANANAEGPEAKRSRGVVKTEAVPVPAPTQEKEKRKKKKAAKEES